MPKAVEYYNYLFYVEDRQTPNPNVNRCKPTNMASEGLSQCHCAISPSSICRYSRMLETMYARKRLACQCMYNPISLGTFLI